ncbi:MAG: hypothetical protein J6W29_09750 [Neisseriaceae bacterium]|nr:hypothetical protein [Neisseriaceae bacterium]
MFFYLSGCLKIRDRVKRVYFLTNWDKWGNCIHLLPFFSGSLKALPVQRIRYCKPVVVVSNLLLTTTLLRDCQRQAWQSPNYEKQTK